MIFCGVFDGHGPMGHKISRHICDSLPSRVHSRIRCGGNVNIENDNNSKSQEGFLEKVLVTLFKRIDSELGLDSPYDSFCSGTTAVTVLKQVNIISLSSASSWVLLKIIQSENMHSSSKEGLKVVSSKHL